MTRQSSFIQYAVFTGLFSMFILIGIWVLNTAYPALAQPNTTTFMSAGQASSRNNTPPVVNNTQPVNISSTKLNLSIPIRVGTYDTLQKNWTLSDSSAYFLEGSSHLSILQGQTILYAHNSAQLFGRLKELKKGDSVTVTDNLGQNFTYTLSHTKDVQPTDTSILSENPTTPRLVLITCGGWFDEIRQVYYFNLTQDLK